MCHIILMSFPVFLLPLNVTNDMFYAWITMKVESGTTFVYKDWYKDSVMIIHMGSSVVRYGGRQTNRAILVL